MIAMEIGGTRYHLDPAAISAIRYRAQYGASIISDLADCSTVKEAKGRLLRMCHMMIPVADRPELLDFAKSARKTPDFFSKAVAAREALLAQDPGMHVPAENEPAEAVFDEYKILALMAVMGLDFGLIYELPIFHLVSLTQQAAELRDPEKKQYRPMTQTEMSRLYPH